MLLFVDSLLCADYLFEGQMPSNLQYNMGCHKEWLQVLCEPKEKRDRNDLSQEVTPKVGLEERVGIW